MPLPTFILIGSARCGTTSLYNYLRSHPEIYMSDIKAPRYFAADVLTPDAKGYGKFKSHFVSSLEEYEAQFAGATTEKAIGEASALYMYYPEVADRIRETLPDVKLLAILRDPVQRAFSHYTIRRLGGKEPLRSFAEAVRAEPKRAAEGWDMGWYYVRRGRYYEQLKPYFERFPRENIHIMLTEDLAADTAKTVTGLYRFLGVDDTFLPDTKRRHKPSTAIPKNQVVHDLLTQPNAVKTLLRPLMPSRVRASLRKSISSKNSEKETIPPALRAELVKGYCDDILKLQDLIGRDLSAWLDEAGR